MVFDIIYLLNSVVKNKSPNTQYIIALQRIEIRFRIQVLKYLKYLIINRDTHNLREKISEYSKEDFVNRFQERIIIIIKMQKLRKMNCKLYQNLVSYIP